MMRKHAIAAEPSKHFASLIFAAVLIGPCAYGASGTIDFSSPAGGEVFFVNKSYTIRLAVKGNFPSIKLELSRDGGQTFASLGTIDNTLSDKSKHNQFQFAPTVPFSADCLLRATGTGKTPVTTVSMPFSIGSAAMVVSTPGSLTGDALAANTITSANLANGSVVTQGLADGSVTNPKIANLAVSSTKITSGPASSKQVLAADGLGGADWTDAAQLGLGTSGPAGGDLAGTYPNPTIASSAGNNLIAAINAGTTTSRLNFGTLSLAGAPFVLKGGDTMTGFLTLSADPTSNLHAATKHYVDVETTRATAAEALSVTRSGDTLTGVLNLPATGLAGKSQGDALIASLNVATSNTLSSSLLSGALPVLDGSNLTGINAAKIGGHTVATTTPLNGQVLSYNFGSLQWEPANAGNGTVTSVAAGTGISIAGGAITSSGSIGIDTSVVPRLSVSNTFATGQTIQTGTAGNVGLTILGATSQSSNLLELNGAGGPLTHFDASGNFSGNAATANSVTGTVSIAHGGTGSTTAQSAFDGLAPAQTGNGGKFLTTNGTTTSWSSITGGTVTSVTAGAGLTGGTITGTGTVAINPLIVPQLNTANDFTVAGAASAPAVRLSGDWNTSGTATTAKPQLLIEAQGASSNGWNTNGTGLGVNAATGFSGLLIDAQANGVSKFTVDVTGIVSGNGSGLSNLNIANSTLSGDVTGTGSATNVVSVHTAAGASIVAAINAATSSSIDGTRINPDFGGQTLATTGSINATGALTIGNLTNTSGLMTLNNGTSGFFGKVKTSTLSANQTYTLPDATGTVALHAIDNGFATGQTINSGADANVAIVARGTATQTGDLAQFGIDDGNNGTTVRSAVDKLGNFTGNAANVTGTVDVAHGGTGATLKADAFNALSPLGTLGDLLFHDGTKSTNLPVGSDGQVLTADSVLGVKWSTPSGSGPSLLAVATTNITTTVNVSDVTVLVLKSGATNTFLLALTGLKPGQLLMVENLSGRTANLDSGGNVTLGNNNAGLLFVDDSGSIRIGGSFGPPTP